MHLISELSDRLDKSSERISEENMLGKRDISILEGILYLKAIEQHKGKRKASAALGMSVDTLNKYLENLEETLGVKLISTSGNGSQLTRVAQRIVEKATKLQEVLDDIKNIRLENKEVKGEVRVSMALGYASYTVPQDLSALFDVFPELTLDTTTATNSDNINAHDFDIVLTYKDIDNPDLVLIKEKTVHCGFFASSRYLARKGYPIDIEDIITNHRLLGKNNSLLKEALTKDQLKRANICFSTNNTLAMINALENNAGIAILPLSFALQGLVCLDNITCNCPITYRLLANRNTKDLPRVRMVINFYKDIIDKLENPVPVPSLCGNPSPIFRRLGDRKEPFPQK